MEMNRMFSKLLKGLFWLLILALLVAPLGLIYEISNREQQEYETPEPPTFVQTAYGTVIEAERQDVKECILVSGVFCSESYEYIELKQREPSKIRWNIEVGDEIQQGQVLGVYAGAEIISPLSGLVAEINAFTSDNAYLKIQLASPVLLECNMTPKMLISLRYAQGLTTEDGETVTVAYTANIRNPDGTTRVLLQIDSGDYYLNQQVEDMPIYTGNVYLQTLVLPEKCLYQKLAGEEEPWYARQVSADGIFISEVEVSRGYSDGDWVCVTGVEEGQFFDSGYKLIAEGGAQT